MSIVLENVTKAYGQQPVVDRLSLEIETGELFVLLGASGSGKSTLLRLIAGLLPLDAGRIALDGRDVTQLPPQARNTGFVFQNYSLFRQMNTAQNIAFGLDIRRRPRAEGERDQRGNRESRAAEQLPQSEPGVLDQRAHGARQCKSCATLPSPLTYGGHGR